MRLCSAITKFDNSGKMSFAKWSQFLMTANGRNVLLAGACCTSVGVFSCYFVPHTFLLEKYKEVVQSYQDGMSRPVLPKLRVRFEKAMDLAEVAPEDRKLFKPFNVFGFDIFNAGSIYSKYGCIVGLPSNFEHDSIDSIPLRDIKVGGESVPWGLDEGQQLLKSMVMSENAQLYAMAREIKMLQTPKRIIDAFSSMLSVIATYSVCVFFNQKLNLYARPFGLRGVMYGLVTCFVGGNYIFIKDCSQLKYEQMVDEELKKTPELAQGGAEFYKKILLRNQALRKLLGKEGESQFSGLGNENYLVRQRHVPIMTRKDFFEKANVEVS